MTYYAKFELINGNLFRFDTRIYLGPHSIDDQGSCIGAIVGKNPGSAKPSQLGLLTALKLDGDKLLPSVRNRYISAFHLAQKPIPDNAYVQVWNLFYICNPDLNSAITAIEKLPESINCPSEKVSLNHIWYAWGGDSKHLNMFKKRFLENPTLGFFFDHVKKQVIPHTPELTEFAKHPQGMTALPIIEHIASVLQ